MRGVGINPRPMVADHPPGTRVEDAPPQGSAAWQAWRAYRLRWRRRGRLYRAWNSRHALTCLADRTSQISSTDILGFLCIRNEAQRLPYFLEYHRKLGVKHFLAIDNGSDDGSTELLRAAPDISVWHTQASYKASRFGMDWVTWLHRCYGAGHWCLTLDADELLIYPHCETQDLNALTRWLDSQGHRSFGTVMLDLFPKGRLGQQPYKAGTDPVAALPYLDTDNFTHHPRPELRNMLIFGGVRTRAFFAKNRRQAPHMNKIPLVKWHRSYAYLDSTHALLPRHLNIVQPAPDAPRTTGALLHTKFLNTIIEKSVEEKQRKQHFTNADAYSVYYDQLIDDPDLWHTKATKFRDWHQLESLGLLSRGKWAP